MKQQSERQLLSDIRSGRSDACIDLVRSNYVKIYRFLLHLTRDVHAAEDLTQETFAAAWKKIHVFEEKSAIGTWLHKIAYNKFIDAERGSNRSLAMVAQVQSRRVESPQRTPLDEVIDGEQSRNLYIAIQSLMDGDRVVIVLHYLQGMSFSEMADVLNEPVGTAKWRTSEALKRLRVLLTAETGHEEKQRS